MKKEFKKVSGVISEIKNEKSFGSKESPVETTLYENNGMKFRCFVKDERIYICLKDLGDSIGATNIQHLKAILDDDKSSIHKVYTVESQLLGNAILFVTEPAMYKILMRSNLPKAQQFSDWAANEVFPSIRKHGAYMTDNFIERTLNDPDYLIQVAMKLKELKEVKAKNNELKAIVNYKTDYINENKHFTEFGQDYEEHGETVDVKKFAGLYGHKIGRNKLYGYMRQFGWVCQSSTEPTQYSLNNGFTEQVIHHIHGVKVIGTRLTTKGQIRLNELLNKELKNKNIQVF